MPLTWYAHTFEGYRYNCHKGGGSDERGDEGGDERGWQKDGKTSVLLEVAYWPRCFLPHFSEFHCPAFGPSQ